MFMGSACLHSEVAFAATPNPIGRSAMLCTITPWYLYKRQGMRSTWNNFVYLGVFSVILPNPLFMMWCPYRNCCSAEAFTQI